MARAETLEILGGIVDQLVPVGDVERGTPLRSADWNTVVAAVSSLARLVASRERTLGDQLEEGFAPAGHDHRGEATLSWFEPDTRQLLENAASGSVDQRLGQQKIESELGTIRGDIKALSQELEQLRLALDQLRDSDFAREQSIGRVETDVEVLRGLEGGLDNLATRITGLDDGIASVLTFREQLEQGGEPSDVGAIEERVQGLEVLRENLITANGELVRIRELESAIARLEEGSINRADVDGLVIDRVRDANLFSDAGFLDDIAGRVEGTLDPRIAAAEAEAVSLRSELETLGETVIPLGTRIDAVDERLAGQAAELEGLATLAPRLDQHDTRLTAAEADLVTAQAATARIPALDQSIAQLGTRMDGFAATATMAETNTAAIGALNTRTAALDVAIGGLPQFTERLAVLEEQGIAVSGLETRLGALEIETAELTTRFEVTEAELTTFGAAAARIDGIERQTAEFADWRVSADRRIAQLSTGPNLAVNERLSRVEEGLAEQRVSVSRLSDQIEPLSRLDVSVRELDRRVVDIGNRIR